MKRISAMLLFFCVYTLFANVQILEQKPGEIKLQITTQPYQLLEEMDSVRIYGECDAVITNLKGEEVPAFSFSIFTKHPEIAKFSYSIESVASYPLHKPIVQGSKDPINVPLSPQRPQKLRNATIHRWDFTPILSTENGQIKQITKATVIITYPPVKTIERPSSPYYKAMARIALNPKEFFTVEPKRISTPRSSRSSRAMSGSYLAVDEKAAFFTVAGNAADETETNGELDGLRKITPNAIASILGTNLPMRSISIYATNPKVSNHKTPKIDEIPDALVPVPAIYRDLNNDDVFNNDDEILFYATGIHSWEYEDSLWNFRFNDFTEKRHYYVRTTQGYNPIETLAQPSGATHVNNSGLQLIRTKKSNRITTAPDAQGWADRLWIWSSISKNVDTFDPKMDLDIKTSYDPHFPGKIKVLRDTLMYSMGDNAIFTFQLPSRDSILTVDNDSGTNTWIPLPLETRRFNLQITGMENSITDIVGFDLSYYRKLNMSGINSLRFYSSDTTVHEPSVVKYEVSNPPAEYSVVIRNNPQTQEMVLVDSTSSPSQLFTWSDSTAKGYEYIITTGSTAQIPKLSAVNNSVVNSFEYLIRDLHNTSNRSDYMIVTPAELLTSSVKIAEHKRSIGTFLNPTVVTTEDIYREFSGGVPDPTAIRNFMTYAYHNWQNPVNGDDDLTYLLLVGTGHYDYKKIKNRNENFIYPYIQRKVKLCPVIEDFFGLVTANNLPGQTITNTPKIAVGRILANTNFDVDNFLDKLKDMESDSGDYSEWRNRFLFLADDDRQQDKVESIKHTQQSDDVAKKILDLVPTARIQKVTLFEYETNGFQKPGAKSDFIDEINKGVSLVNFFGHGGYASMTDEGIFDTDDILSLRNDGHYLLFLAFSCSVGFFDQPGKDCVAGMMVNIADKGAHTAIASTRKSYAPENKGFAIYLYDELFTAENNSSIGVAYLKAKEKINQSTYAIFGDPSFTPLLKNRNIELDIQDEAGNSIDTMKAVQFVRVKAKMPSGHTVDSVRIQLENPEQTDVRRKDGYSDYNIKLNDTISYKLPGKILLNQAFAVEDNQLDVKITIPPIVQQNVDGTKLRAYGWSNENSSTVTGIKTGLYFDGIDYANLDTTDKTGPNITIRLAQDSSEADTALPGCVGNKIVIDGFYVNTQDSLHVEQDPAIVELFFSDSSGIDIFGENVGEGITISLTDIRTSKNYNGSFRSIGDSPNKGKVTLSLRHDEFPRPGEYELVVTAADFNKNITKERFIVDVKSTEQGLYNIGDFYAYPSPAHIGEHTRFYYNAPDFRVHRMTLKIFTLSGQLVRQFNDVRPGVCWDLKDQRGNQLSPDVYLYRLYVERDADEDIDIRSTKREKEIITSAIRKMIIYPPR